MAHDSHTATHAKALPADLSAPAFVDGWKKPRCDHRRGLRGDRRGLAFLPGEDDLGWDHVVRAWVLGTMLTFGWSVGGLALLMVQYLLRRQVGTAAAPSA
jgi:hypothetical protein